MDIGIFGGSFNPVHAGHTMLASYLQQWTALDQVWFMLSPLNPLKDVHELLPDAMRWDMLQAALHGCHGMRACDVELSMPVPSYTIDTLRELHRRFPDDNFRLIIGSDNWAIMDRWREPDAIIKEFGVIIYPRPGYEVDGGALPPNVWLTDAPVCSLSSTMIRSAIAQGRDVSYFLPPGVYDYIKQNHLYNYH